MIEVMRVGAAKVKRQSEKAGAPVAGRSVEMMCSKTSGSRSPPCPLLRVARKVTSARRNTRRPCGFAVGVACHRSKRERVHIAPPARSDRGDDRVPDWAFAPAGCRPRPAIRTDRAPPAVTNSRFSHAARACWCRYRCGYPSRQQRLYRFAAAPGIKLGGRHGPCAGIISFEQDRDNQWSTVAASGSARPSRSKPRVQHGPPAAQRNVRVIA